MLTHAAAGTRDEVPAHGDRSEWVSTCRLTMRVALAMRGTVHPHPRPWRVLGKPVGGSGDAPSFAELPAAAAMAWHRHRIRSVIPTGKP
jgi:hypothetical protein